MAATRERGATSEALLRAAEHEIAEHGTGGFSLRAIARRAGVSHQAPGFLYGDRKGLLTALAIEGSAKLTGLTREMLAELPEDADAAARVQVVGIAYVKFAEAHPGMFGVMMRPEIHTADNPELQAAKAECFGLLVDALQDAQAKGWAADRPLDSLALLCWSIVHGVVTLIRDGTLGLMFPGMSAEEAARRVTSETAAAYRLVEHD